MCVAVSNLFLSVFVWHSNVSLSKEIKKYFMFHIQSISDDARLQSAATLVEVGPPSIYSDDREHEVYTEYVCWKWPLQFVARH